MTSRLVLILVGLLLINSGLLGFWATPYSIGKLAATVMPMATSNWLLDTILQQFRAIAVFIIFRELIFLYFVPFLLILALRFRMNWLKIAMVSYGIGFFSLLLPFLSIGDLGLILAIAVTALSVFTGSLTRLFWQKGLPRISSFSTVILGLIFGIALGIFVISAYFSLETLGALPWTTLLLPIFLLQLCLAFSLNHQLKIW